MPEGASTDRSRNSDKRLSRRRVLNATGASVLTSVLAGCPGGGSEDSPTQDGSETPDTSSTRDGSEKPGSGAGQFDFEYQFDSFVTAGTAGFTVDGESYYPTGGNHPQLRKQPFAAQVDWFDQWTGLTGAVDALRATAFGTGRENTDVPLQPRPGDHDEAAFRALDRMVALAGHYGVRLVLPLANYWPWQGGLPNYRDWVGYENRSDFYTSDEAQESYRTHIATVLNRENHLTGVTYKDDPAIMMWELMNEPRLGSARVEEFMEWVRASAEHVRNIDPNHLVSTGLGGGPVSDVPAYYERVNSLDVIDAWSIHVWADPDHQDTGIGGGIDWIRDHTAAAHELDMPAYVGEFGWPVVRDGDGDATEIKKRNEAFEAWLIAMRHYDTDGALVWDFRHDDEYPLEWNRYGVFPRDPGTRELFADQYGGFGSPVTSESIRIDPPSLSTNIPRESGRKRYTVTDTGGGVPDDPAFSMEPSDEYLIEGGSSDVAAPDLSGEVYLGYDADNLYVTVEVTDDIHTATSKGAMWQRDAVQWAVAAGGTYGPEYGFARVDDEAAVHRWLDGTATADTDAVDLRTRREDTLTTYEATVPWEAVFSTAPSPGDTFPFGLTINDYDTRGDRPNHVLGWTDGAIWDEKAANALGLLTLEGGPSPGWQADLLGGPDAVEQGSVGEWEFQLNNLSENEQLFDIGVVGSDVFETLDLGSRRTARITLSRAFAERGVRAAGIEIVNADTGASETATAKVVVVSDR